VLLGLLTLAGAVLTGLFAQSHVAYALALSSGVTIYVAASDLIPEVNRAEDSPSLAYTVFGGLLFFIAVDWAFAEYLTP
jgi:zinc transporter ZupT